ncbi:MAG: amidohydrolase family protein [Pseudomonadota bacterium]
MWSGAAQAQEARADLLLVDGKILTVDPLFSIAQAVAVAGDRIIAVGGNDAIRRLAAPGARVIELAGKTVIPGLIDNHGHYARAAQSWSREARLDGIGSRRDAIAALQAKARIVAPNDWVLALGGWSEGQLADDPTGFTRDELDRAIADHPVYLQVNYSHAYANSRALAAAGIDDKTPDPSGGKIERGADGKATGKLIGAAAYMLVYRTIPPSSPSRRWPARAR